MNRLEAYAHQHFLPYRTTYHMQLCVEELLENAFLPAGIASVRLAIRRDGEASLAISFLYPGTENVWDSMDDIPRKLLEGVCARHEFSAPGAGQDESCLTVSIVS